jgi:hypothetical protein
MCKYLKMATVSPINGLLHYHRLIRPMARAKKRDLDLPVSELSFQGRRDSHPEGCFRFSYVGRIIVHVIFQLAIIEDRKEFQIQTKTTVLTRRSEPGGLMKPSTWSCSRSRRTRIQFEPPRSRKDMYKGESYNDQMKSHVIRYQRKSQRNPIDQNIRIERPNRLLLAVTTSNRCCEPEPNHRLRAVGSAASHESDVSTRLLNMTTLKFENLFKFKLSLAHDMMRLMTSGVPTFQEDLSLRDVV